MSSELLRKRIESIAQLATTGLKHLWSKTCKQFWSKSTKPAYAKVHWLITSSQREEELLEATRRRDHVNQQISQISTKISVAKDSLKRKQEEAASK
jgi:hypothetical protein